MKQIIPWRRKNLPQKGNDYAVTASEEKIVSITEKPRILVYGTRILSEDFCYQLIQYGEEKLGTDNIIVELSRNVELIEEAFYNMKRGESLEQSRLRGDVPKMVIIFSKMRWYPEHGGCDVNTSAGHDEGKGYRRQIEELCLEHSVPCVYLDESIFDESTGEFRPLTNLAHLLEDKGDETVENSEDANEGDSPIDIR